MGHLTHAARTRTAKRLVRSVCRVVRALPTNHLPIAYSLQSRRTPKIYIRRSFVGARWRIGAMLNSIGPAAVLPPITSLIDRESCHDPLDSSCHRAGRRSRLRDTNRRRC